ncbi:MAG: hypothetical protein J0L78_16355 [Planctomycetes bacterium]|nr:hypothetical protein [Planctomycetota bacterium]
MSKSLRAGRWVNPGSLNSIDPKLQSRFFQQYRNELEPHGVFLRDGLDDEAIRRVMCGEVSGLSAELIDRIGVIDEMSTSGNHELLLDEAKRLGLDIGPTPSTADLVVLLLLDGTESLERIYAERLPLARRLFRSHFALTADPPIVSGVPDHVLKGYEDGLEQDFVGRGRGSGVRVFHFPTTTGFRQMIRRADVAHRDVSVDPLTGGRQHIIFHPERFDVLIYDHSQGEMQVNAKHDADVRAYLEHVGHHLFTHSQLFLAEGLPAKYTLKPILEREQACLRCDDVPELEAVWLRGLDWAHPKAIDLVERPRSKSDLFRAMNDAGRGIPRSVKLMSATFNVVFKTGREGQLRIVLPNNAVYSRESDSEVILRWLGLRGFLQDRGKATDGLTRALVASS